MAPCWSQPLVEGCDQQGGLLAKSTFVVPGCDSAVPLEAVDPALDRMALAVVGRDEGRRPAATGAEHLAIACLVGLFGMVQRIPRRRR